jgi:hypothetical protein
MKTNILIVSLILLVNFSFAQTNEEIVNYFNSICGTSEHGESWGISKWKRDVHIFVVGEKIPYLETELRLIVNELNSIINTINIDIVYTWDESNLIVFFGSAKSYVERTGYYDEHNLLNICSGLSTSYGNPSIHHAKAFINTEKEKSEVILKHILREEVTQTLGFGNDTYDYPDSIFYQGFSQTNSYSKIDIEIIKMLYNN